eukprot:4084312-Pleurochrysis_carterae.AAC.1
MYLRAEYVDIWLLFNAVRQAYIPALCEGEHARAANCCVSMFYKVKLVLCTVCESRMARGRSYNV